MYFLVKFKIFGFVGFLARVLGMANHDNFTQSYCKWRHGTSGWFDQFALRTSPNFEFWQFSEIVEVDKSGGFQTHFWMASKIEWPWWDQMRDIWNISSHHVRLAIRFALRHGLPSGLSLARIVHNFPMISPHGLRSQTPMFVLDQELTIWIANPNGRQHHVVVAPGDEGDLDLFRFFFKFVSFLSKLFSSIVNQHHLVNWRLHFCCLCICTWSKLKLQQISCLYSFFEVAKSSSWSAGVYYSNEWCSNEIWGLDAISTRSWMMGSAVAALSA